VNNWKVIPTIVLTTVLIFGAGVFAGGMLVDYVKQNHKASVNRRQNPPPLATNPPAASLPASSPPATNSPSQPKPARPPEILSKEFLQRLDTELHLTKEEHESVQKIINDGQNEMRKVLQDARLEIREVLAPGQREQFDELLKRPFHKPIFATNAPPNLTITPTNAP
jgi:uncharacterized membrane protein